MDKQIEHVYGRFQMTNHEQAKAAMLAGAASGIVGAIRNADADLLAKHRRQLPDLWERLDRLVELVDERDKGWTSDLW